MFRNMMYAVFIGAYESNQVIYDGAHDVNTPWRIYHLTASSNIITDYAEIPMALAIL